METNDKNAKLREWNEKRKQAMLEKIETKVRNTQTNKVTRALTNYDYDTRKRHFFNPENPDEEYPEGLYVLEPIWPYEEYGIECGKGWVPLIQPVIEYIQQYNKNKDDSDKIVIHQIKEKFGRLEIYLNRRDNEELNKLIDNAKQQATEICEICGTKENVGFRCNGWVGVTCEDCLVKDAAAAKRQYKWRRYVDGKIFLINPDGTIIEC